jgi:hypothetical protein
VECLSGIPETLVQFPALQKTKQNKNLEVKAGGIAQVIEHLRP